MKKIIALTIACMLLFSSFCLAAVSSSKSSSKPASRPSTSTVAPTSPQTKQAAPNDSGYKPSAPANSYSDKGPASQVKPGTQQNQQPSSSGGFWRSAGMFGAGMLAGSFLSHMFGFGSMGAMSSVFGVLINILFIVAVIAVIRFIWNKFRNQDRRNM